MPVSTALRSFFAAFNPFASPTSRSHPSGKTPSFKERFTALQNLPRFFRLIWQTSKWLTLASVTLRLFRAALPASALYVGKLIIDEVVRLVQHQTQDASHLWEFIALEFALALASDLLSRGVSLADSLLGDLFANRTSIELMQHAATMDLEMFEDSEFYDKLEKARRQTTSRINLMSQALMQGQDLISMVLLAAGLIYFAPWLMLLLLVTVIPGFIGEANFNARSYSLMNSWTPKRRELDYLRFIGASDETAKEVKIFGLSDFLTDRYKTLSDEYYRENRTLAIKRASWGVTLAAVASTGYYAAYVYIILQTVRGAISLGDLTFLAGSFRSLRSSLETVLSRFAGIAEGAVYLRDLFEFFEIKPVITSPQKPLPFPHPIREGFVFENVGFKYANSERWALRNLSFTLQAGEKLALVGENGAGKTTLVKLLGRLYEPTEGRILLDGCDLRDYDVAELRSETGVIFQDFVRYQMTAGTNIAVGRIEEQTNKPRIEHSAAQSLADSVVDGLPQGYEQMIGRRFAGGTELSGGQWQKMALARAYMRDAQVLILDEPTAALDARAEYEIFQRFAELTQGKTAVLISHRFSTVRMADRILVLDGGTLAEIGSHEELLEQGERYAELFRLQAKGYM